MSDALKRMASERRGGVTACLLLDPEIKEEHEDVVEEGGFETSSDDCIFADEDDEYEDDDNDDDDDEEEEEEEDGDDKRGHRTYNINFVNMYPCSHARDFTGGKKVNTNIPGGNDIDRQFYQILDSIGEAYMSGAAWNEDTTIIRNLVTRMIRLWTRQIGERKAVREGWMREPTVNTYFGFDIPHWRPERTDPPSVYREWVSELLFLLTPQ